jgi:glycosyltransferase involved in cell wall biosynthesis
VNDGVNLRALPLDQVRSAFGRTRPLRVAVVHDWLYVLGGAEKVLAAILRCLPTADIFALFDTLQPADRAAIGYRESRTSFLQRMPGIRRNHRPYLPLMPLAIEQLDLSDYDLVVSSSSSVAKGVLTGPDQIHIAYVHSPMRYAWDLQHQYLRETATERGLKSLFVRWMLHRARMWDVRTAHGVDTYVANSRFVARRIRKIYGRGAEVIYPPVRISPELKEVEKQPYFFTASRLVPYKNIRAIVQAFRDLPQHQLVVGGDGPERKGLEAIASSNTRFVGFVPDAELQRMMRECLAFVFAAEEDFGIVPLEAQAAGTPVIALGRGGVLETIVTSGPKPTGLFFEVPEPDSIAAAVQSFLAQRGRFAPIDCFLNAQRFSEATFEQRFTDLVRRHLDPTWAADMEFITAQHSERCH